MGEKEKFIKFIDDVKIKEGFTLDKEFADLFNISTSNLAGYKSTRNIPKSWKLWYCKRYDITLNHLEDFLNDRSQNVENSEIIQNQKKLLEYQEKDIERLKEENGILKEKSIESKSFKEKEYDHKMEVVCSLSLRGLKRKMISISNIDIMAEKLGYTKKEIESFLDFDKYHLFNDHPITKIVDEKSNKMFSKEAIEYPNILEIEKSMEGDSYHCRIFKYIHKDGSMVPVIAYIKLLWWKGGYMDCKVKYLTD
jgi:hypothetical protein